MYRQECNEKYGRHESYSECHGQYAGYNTDSAAPSSYGSQPRIVLDDYNSDLNFVIESDGVTGSSLHKDGFEYMWAGARATHGIRTGKVRYNKTLLRPFKVRSFGVIRSKICLDHGASKELMNPCPEWIHQFL